MLSSGAGVSLQQLLFPSAVSCGITWHNQCLLLFFLAQRAVVIAAPIYLQRYTTLEQRWWR